jgi:MFS family permease
MLLSPTLAFLLVSFSLGELGDGLNIFQGIYLVAIGWNEGAVGTALSLMGLTALIVQTFAGDLVDKTLVDRRIFLGAACLATAFSASMIFFVQPGNSQHMLIFISKIIEGVASSFIGPCLAALTLANFGPHFDAVMANNILYGHIGSAVAAILAGFVAYYSYPNIKYCFLVIGASALSAVVFVQFLPEGDKLMGRGFQGKQALDEFGHVEQLQNKDDENEENVVGIEDEPIVERNMDVPRASSYWDVICNRRCLSLCLAGFFFQYVKLHFGYAGVGPSALDWIIGNRLTKPNSFANSAQNLQFRKCKCTTCTRRTYGGGHRRRWCTKPSGNSADCRCYSAGSNHHGEALWSALRGDACIIRNL